MYCIDYATVCLRIAGCTGGLGDWAIEDWGPLGRTCKSWVSSSQHCGGWSGGEGWSGGGGVWSGGGGLLFCGGEEVVRCAGGGVFVGVARGLQGRNEGRGGKWRKGRVKYSGGREGVEGRMW